jgi:hypothetical protein
VTDCEDVRCPDRSDFEHMLGYREDYRRLADAIATVLPAGTVLDISAGVGYVPARLGELGWEVSASDGFSDSDLRDPQAGWLGWNIDLTKQYVACSSKYSTVICTETAEHISEEFADNIVRNVVDRAKECVVWSAAQPGQPWRGHINMQPSEYWLSRFANCGWTPDPLKTALLRAEMLTRQAQHEKVPGNFFVLQRVP